MTGTISVDGAINGPMSNPKINGNFDLVDVGVPKLNISHATGRMQSRDPYDPRSQASPINAHVEMKDYS